MNDLTVTDCRFTAADRRLRETGLLGWIRLTIPDGAQVVDGLLCLPGEYETTGDEEILYEFDREDDGTLTFELPRNAEPRPGGHRR